MFNSGVHIHVRVNVGMRAKRVEWRVDRECDMIDVNGRNGFRVTNYVSVLYASFPPVGAYKYLT